MPQETNQQKHILVINDDQAVLQLFDDLLSEEGYRVTLDNFGRPTTDLLEVVRELKPDLVILDFIIGGELKGWQLLQAIKMDRTTRDIPAIICTAAAKQVTEIREHLDSMSVHVVLKPFDIDHLIAIIDKVWASLESPTPGLDTLTTAELEDAIED